MVDPSIRLYREMDFFETINELKKYLKHLKTTGTIKKT